jgi:hypothetical protein
MSKSTRISVEQSFSCLPPQVGKVTDIRTDPPEKWKHFTEINESYVNGGKFTPAEFAKHQATK